MEVDGFLECLENTCWRKVFVQESDWVMTLTNVGLGKNCHSDKTWTWTTCRDTLSYILYFYFTHLSVIHSAGRGWCQYSVSHTWQPSKFNWTDSALLMRDLSTGFSYYRVPVCMPGALWQSELSPHSPQSLTRIASEEQSDAQDQQQPGLFPGVCGHRATCSQRGNGEGAPGGRRWHSGPWLQLDGLDSWDKCRCPFGCCCRRLVSLAPRLKVRCAAQIFFFFLLT